MTSFNLRPTHLHDCQFCVFLGKVCTVNPANLAEEIWDLYFCEARQPGSVSVIARYGKDSLYMSYPVFTSKVPSTKVVDQLYAMTPATHGAFVSLAARLTAEAILGRATPACEVCKRPVREGLRFCAGLSFCWKQGVGL